jgi:hypothetical protein
LGNIFLGDLYIFLWVVFVSFPYIHKKCKPRIKKLLFFLETNEQAENVSGLFTLLNNCYVKFMHLHIRELIYNLLPLLMGPFNGNIKINDSQSAIIKIGDIAFNTNIEVNII